ncbi:MAG: sulfotransferase [Myxococcota bacterium]|nr:sulfotransferase [Myxococcota bacterium]
MAEPKRVMLVGNGRSGTNWLNDILDASPVTHCRMSPWLVPDSAFHDLPKGPAVAAHAGMAEDWARFVDWSQRRFSKRDHRLTAPKTWLHGPVARSGLAAHAFRPKARRLLRPIAPNLTRSEWRLPAWLGSEERLLQSVLVLKMDDPWVSWLAAWVAENDPATRLVHLVRHPGGFLNSAVSRWFSTLDPETSAREDAMYKGALAMAVEDEPAWADVFGSVEEQAPLESVMWFWRMSNERLAELTGSSDRHQSVRYEDLTADPVGRARALYESLELEWDAGTRDRVERISADNHWGDLGGSPSQVAEAWRSKLDPEHLALVERVLRGSTLSSFWA